MFVARRRHSCYGVVRHPKRLRRHGGGQRCVIVHPHHSVKRIRRGKRGNRLSRFLRTAEIESQRAPWSQCLQSLGLIRTNDHRHLQPPSCVEEGRSPIRRCSHQEQEAWHTSPIPV